MPPPRFSAASAERLQDVVGFADDAVDAGVTPNAAIAKAARDASLPVGHVPLAVRAFNTGRAVRQLGESDPWAKAAAYPQASVEGVIALLGASPTKPKVANSLADYNTPPVKPKKVEPVVKIAAAKSEPVAAPIKVAADTTLRTLFQITAGLDAISTFALSTTAGEYAAVKQAALKRCPEAAAVVFGRIEDENYSLVKKAQAKPDAAVKTHNHPVVLAVEKIAELRASQVVVDRDPVPPVGWKKVAGCEGLFVRGPHNALLGLPIPDAVKAAAAPEKPKGLLLDRPVVKTAGFGSAFSRGLSIAQPLGGAFQSATLGNTLKIWPGSADGGAMAKRIGDPVDAGMGHIDQQANIQNMLADRRFVNADPREVVSTYHKLYSLAPLAMENPAVAGDFIHRALQTGPPSYYDLQALTTINKNIAGSRRPDRDDDE